MMFKLAGIISSINPGLKSILANISWLVTEKVLRMFVSLMVGVWVVRYLGPERYGSYSYAIAIVSLLMPLSSMGIEQILTRNLIRDPSSRDSALGTAFILKLVGGIIVIPASLILASLLRPEDKATLVLIGIISISEVIRSLEVIDFWFGSKVQSKYSAIAKSASLSINTVIKLVLISVNADIIFFIAAYSVDFLLSCSFLVIIYCRKVDSIIKWNFNFHYAIQLIKDCWPLIFSGFVIAIYMRSDQIMISQIMGDREVGIYSAAVRISEMWYFIPGAILNSVVPSIVKARQQNLTKYYDRLSQVSAMMILIAYSAAILTTLFSTQLIQALYGSDYSSASAVLSLHIWTGCFVVIGLIRGTHTSTENISYISFVSMMMGALINISLNYFLIPAYGLVGAAMATLAAQAFASYICSIFFTKTRKLFFIQSRACILADLPKVIKDFR